MKRHLCLTALFAVVLIPDWASACWPRRGPVFVQSYCAPVYHAPLCWAVQPVCCPPVYTYPAVPVPGSMPAPLKPPRVGQPKGKPGSSQNALPAPAPSDAEIVRPASGTGGPKPPVAPSPSEPKKPAAEDRIPPVELPKPGGGDAKLPPLELPKDENPKIPPLELPKDPAPKIPPVGADPKIPPLVLPDAGSPAVPIPAPAPDLTPAPPIPSPKAPDSLPPLTLPPDSPVAPPKVVEAKSSPLATVRELKVSVFPAAGTAAAVGLRKVGFYNHTGRDLTLTVEGKSVKLPAMSYLHAQLPPTFNWQCADRPLAKETVPAGAAGVDVLIRE